MLTIAKSNGYPVNTINDLNTKLIEQPSSLRMILGSKHVWSDFECFNVTFYVSALVGVIIKMILQNARCNNKDGEVCWKHHDLLNF